MVRWSSLQDHKLSQVRNSGTDSALAASAAATYRAVCSLPCEKRLLGMSSLLNFIYGATCNSWSYNKPGSAGAASSRDGLGAQAVTR